MLLLAGNTGRGHGTVILAGKTRGSGCCCSLTGSGEFLHDVSIKPATSTTGSVLFESLTNGLRGFFIRLLAGVYLLCQ
ncbi:hypothetical protein ACQFN5_26810 [Klebsiella sp. WOUb02]|uniref:hypothetical protein n=1 Tax=Klebsiella sp. WOUb02 TaxID=3161071 RepID=UPI003CF018A1